MTRWTLIAVTAAGVVLSGCAPTMEAASPAGGIVNANYSMGQKDAFDLANAHCQKYGKVARVSGQNEWRNTLTFDCVAP